jgi:Zn-dependent peptidase ImmA (M78 family)
MTIDSRKRNQIKELAEFLALEYSETITPLNKIAHLEEVPIFYDDYGNAFDGTLVYDNGYYIHMNTALGNTSEKERGRFTLAHELGHYFIDSHRNALKEGLIEPHPSRYNKNKHQIIEREADFFASCILMPEKRFRLDCERYRRFDYSIIEDLSKKCHVSITACAIRFADIGTHPIMVVYMEDNHIKWRWQSKELQFLTMPDGRVNVPQDSLAGQYFRTGFGQKRTEELWYIDWFEDKNDNHLNCKVFEQVIPYKNKALSIVWRA